jgi:hypothetical protein
MIVAVYARKSTDQYGVADEAKSVIRQIEHARFTPLGRAGSSATNTSTLTMASAVPSSRRAQASCGS